MTTRLDRPYALDMRIFPSSSVVTAQAQDLAGLLAAPKDPLLQLGCDPASTIEPAAAELRGLGGLPFARCQVKHWSRVGDGLASSSACRFGRMRCSNICTMKKTDHAVVSVRELGRCTWTRRTTQCTKLGAIRTLSVPGAACHVPVP